MFKFNDFVRVMLSADMGADGGSSAGEEAALDPGVGETGNEGAGAAAPDEAAALAEFAQQYGGLEGLRRMQNEHRQVSDLYRLNPDFRDYLNAALRGEHGPKAQREAQQQVQQPQGGQGGRQQPQGRQKADPGTLAAMQMYHRELQRAQQSENPEDLQRLMNDPQFAKAREAYNARLERMNNFWFDDESLLDEYHNNPERIQTRQAEIDARVQEQLLPHLERFELSQWQQWYQGANKQAYNSLPNHIKQALERGVFGRVGAVRDGVTAQDWIKASTAAIAEAQKLAQTGQQAPRQGQPAENAVVPPRRNGANGVKRPEGQRKSDSETIREFARAEAREKLAESRKT